MIFSILADCDFFGSLFDEVNIAAADACAPLAGSRVGVASSDDCSVANFASLHSCQANVNSLCLAWLKAAQLEVECSQTAAVLQFAWDIVCNNNIFCNAAAAVCNGDRVVNRIAWAYLLWTAFFASQDWLCTEQSAESDWSCCGAEASAKFAFAFAFQPYTGALALAFIHGRESPCQSAAFHLCWGLASDIGYTFRKGC